MKVAAIIGLLLAAVNCSQSANEVKVGDNSKNDTSYEAIVPEKKEERKAESGSPVLGRLAAQGINQKNDSPGDSLHSFGIVPGVNHNSSVEEEEDSIYSDVSDIDMPSAPNNGSLRSFLHIVPDVDDDEDSIYSDVSDVKLPVLTDEFWENIINDNDW